MNFEIQDVEIRCDEPGCGWTQKTPWAGIPEWHRKPCPKCGNGQIISDADLINFRMVSAWADCANNEILPQTGPVVEMVLDTAPLRTSNARLDRHAKEGPEK